MMRLVGVKDEAWRLWLRIQGLPAPTETLRTLRDRLLREEFYHAPMAPRRTPSA